MTELSKDELVRAVHQLHNVAQESLIFLNTWDGSKLRFMNMVARLSIALDFSERVLERAAEREMSKDQLIEALEARLRDAETPEEAQALIQELVRREQ